jgi:urease accessory protein
MGNATTRITAQDFVTPAELADYQLAANGAGRIGGLRLELSGRPTRLTACYQQVPLRVLALDLGPAQPRLVYVLNPTAGLFDGDAQLVEVDVAPDSRVFIAGQSATRIHPCLHGFGTQQWRLRVAAGAIVVILPGPAIPFQGCRYYQRAEVELAEGAHLIWGDLWLPGRYARDTDSERFQFQTLIQDFTVRHAGRMVFRDRFCWHGPWDSATADWHFGGADAYGTLFSTYSDDVLRDAVAPECGGEGDPRQASFRTGANQSCLRWLGSAQAVTAAVTRSALSLAAQAEGKIDPWLLASHDLAPNHWFSSHAADDKG